MQCATEDVDKIPRLLYKYRGTLLFLRRGGPCAKITCPMNWQASTRAWENLDSMFWAHFSLIYVAELKILDAHHGYTRITGNVGKVLQRSTTTKIMATKLKEREGWEHEIFENIDCQSRATAIKGMNDNNKKQIFKMSHGSLPVMRQQERFGYSDNTICPVCKCKEETITHM